MIKKQQACSAILQEIQAKDMETRIDINYNFILGGEDMIFQGSSFDLNAGCKFSELCIHILVIFHQTTTVADGLKVLFIGNYTTEAPPQTLLATFHNFLQFAVDAGKLSENYRLYGERQFLGNSKKRDKLDEALEKPPFDVHFDPETAETKTLISWRN